ncbi:MAG: OmpW family outer membrane protein [Bacteroidota bacterium]
MKTIFTTLLLFVFSLSSVYAQNDDYSKLTLKISGLRVVADENDNIEGKDLTISNDYGFEIGLNYFFNKNIAVEFSLASSKHKAVLQYNGIEYIGGYYDIGKLTMVPINLNFQYYFYFNKFKPYLGAGINYSSFYVKDKELIGGVYGGKFDDAIGFILQGGINYDINKKWFVNLDLKKLFLTTDMTTYNGWCGTAAKGMAMEPCPDYNIEEVIEEVDINPLSLGLGIGYNFGW